MKISGISEMDLSGTWRVQLDPEDAGIRNAWQNRSFDERTLKDAPAELRPLNQPSNGWFQKRRLALMFEAIEAERPGDASRVITIHLAESIRYYRRKSVCRC